MASDVGIKRINITGESIPSLKDPLRKEAVPYVTFVFNHALEILNEWDSLCTHRNNETAHYALT